MSDNTKKNKLDKAFGIVLLCCGIALLCGILFLAYAPLQTMGEHYRILKQADVSKEFSESIYYDDGLIVSLGFGISNDPKDPNSAEYLSSFLRSSVQSIDQSILSIGLIYITVISGFVFYYLYQKYRDSKLKCTLSILLSVLLLYGIYAGVIALLHRLFGMPFMLPDGHGCLLLLAGLLSIQGGLCALLCLIRRVRFKKILTLIAIPLLLAAFILGTPLQNGIYTSPTQESFSYIAEIDPRILDEEFSGEYYYDEEKNVVVVERKEYPPEQVENTEYLKGLPRIGAYLFEILYPFSGNSLAVVDGILEKPISLLAPLLHMLKGVFWIVLSLFVKNR